MPAPHHDSHLAPSQARSVAYVLDLVACSLLLLPAALASYCVGIPNAGAFEYSLLFPAYHFFFLVYRGGASPGKHVQNIAVITPEGLPIAAGPALLRSTSLALPWCLLSADSWAFSMATLPRTATAAITLAGAFWLAIDALLIEYTRDRRSLSDRIAGTVVVSLPPLQPHRAPATPMFSANDAEFGNPPKRPPQ